MNESSVLLFIIFKRLAWLSQRLEHPYLNSIDTLGPE
jgi:hypothetical protein